MTLGEKRKRKWDEFFDESLFTENTEAIKESNFAFYRLFNEIMVFLLAVLYLSTFFTDYASALIRIYWIFITVSAGELLAMHWFKRKLNPLIMPICYFGIAKAYLFCLLTSVFYNRDASAITYYVFLILIPVAFLLKPKVMVLIQTVSMLSFACSTILVKDPEIAVGDVFSVLLFYTISLVIATQECRLHISNLHMAGVEKKRNAELETNRDLMRAAIESATMSVWEYHARERTIELVCAPQAKTELAALSGKTPEAVIDSGYIHWNSAAKFHQLFAAADRGEAACFAEIQVFPAEKGSAEWRYLRLTATADKETGAAFYIGTATDITERKNAQLQYEEQLRILDSVNEENLITKGRWNLTTNIQEMVSSKKASAVPIDGLVTYESAMEMMVSGVIPKEREEEMRAILQRQTLIDEFKKGNDHYTLVYQRKTASQDLLWVSMQIRICTSPKNNDVIAFAFSSDVTDEMLNRTIVDRMLTDEYDYFGTVVAKTRRYQIRSVRSDMAGTFAKPTGAKATMDYDADALQAIDTIVAPEEREALRKKLTVAYVTNALETEPSLLLTYSVVTDRGTICRKRMMFCYLDESKATILFSRTDITKVYELEQEQLRRTKELLDRAEQANAAKSVFLSRMSHDMRTPMNGIIGMTRLTQELPDLPAEVRDNLNAIADSSMFLLNLINDTLDMSRIESNRVVLKPEIINSDELVKNVLLTVTPLVNEKHITLEFVPINAELEYIRADRIRAHQIFMNILSNAIKFTPEGGRIRMEIECLKREKGIAYDRISIEDNGIGMSEAFLAHIYEPFAQENGNTPTGMAGTGLGMSIVKSLVELMGGSIEIESKLGKGTKVTVYLSFERAYDYQPSKPQEVGGAAAALAGKHVLLAEDHPLNAAIAVKLLEKKGVSTDRVENGKEAAERFAASAIGFYDAVLMDIRMPVMDGIEAARAIRALDRADAASAPIIAMTANAYDEDVEQSRGAGMNAHLAKPIDPELLYKTLERCIRESEQRVKPPED